MIRKLIIRVLLVFMVVAFVAVVVVQWLWIKYAVEERQDRFSSRVYDALYQTVNRVDDINYIKYLQEMYQQLGQIQNYNDFASKFGNNFTNALSSSYLSNFLHNDINNLRGGERSYLSSEQSYSIRSKDGKLINQEFIVQAIQSMDFVLDDPNVERKMHEAYNEKLREIMLKIARERNPRNISIQKRLENIDLYRMLHDNFVEQKINIPFSYEILTRKDVLDKVRDEKTRNFFYVSLFPTDYVKDFYLGVSFASIQSVVLENIGWLFFASGFCIFGLMFVFAVTIIIIMRQQKLSVIKNDFINNMTHEFKTPIATISLATSAIGKEQVYADKEKLMKFNDIIRDENERMNKYVERILQQAKLDRNEVYLNKADIDMNEVVRQAARHFMLQVQKAGGTLETHLDAPEFTYYADEVHMLNAVCNLIDNAIKYSEEAPEIELYTRIDKNNYIIGVKDNGIGISKEAQKKVFERFYRVTTGNLHNVKGFGLGLNYVKSIVELHNGVVRLTSKKGKGTLVEILLKKK